MKFLREMIMQTKSLHIRNKIMKYNFKRMYPTYYGEGRRKLKWSGHVEWKNE